MHVYRWDLDRTYLDTDIHSVRGMIRAAVETATDKRTIPGADALVRALVDRDPSVRIAVLSGSPTQMREVLEEKLALDGIRVDSMILKNNLRNIRRGRFRAVRGQLGYKLPQLLAARLSEPAGTTESLFGDDAEVDALVYALYDDAIAGRIDASRLEKVLRAGGAYDDQIEHALRSLGRIQPSPAVREIFIHVDRGLPLAKFDLLGSRVHVVFSWLQAALTLHARGRLDPAGVARVARSVSAARALTPRAIANLIQDAVRRGLVEAPVIRALFEQDADLAPLRAPTLTALDQLGDYRRPTPVSAVQGYAEFLSAASVGT